MHVLEYRDQSGGARVESRVYLDRLMQVLVARAAAGMSTVRVTLLRPQCAPARPVDHTIYLMDGTTHDDGADVAA